MRLSSQIFSLVAIFVLVCSRESVADDSLAKEEKSDSDYLTKTVWDCAKDGDIEICLKSKVARYLDNLIEAKEPLPITDYLYLTRSVNGKALNDQDENKAEEVKIEPWDNDDEKSGKLDTIIWNKLSSLYRTKSLKLAFPTETFQGRQKMKGLKKGGGMILMAGMMAGMMFKMAMAKVALIAGKALIVAKIALVLSLIIGLKKLLSHEHSGGHSEVVYTTAEHVGGGGGGGGGGHGWQRQFNVDPVWRENGARMAYRAHIPSKKISTYSTTYDNKDNSIS